ncbi:MAG TPA: ogr/Delta-like zinc finger family protein [Sphingomonas sp.]|nr:ogr/Delta-like zinc finger family protein [Sphingomonas sp.]
MTTKKKLTRLPAIHCPHCGTRSIVRDSVQVTELVRELRLVCENDDCGHSCVAQLSIIRTIRPAAQPRPDIRLPFGDWRSRPVVDVDGKPDNDNHPDPANDDGIDQAAGIGTAIAAAMTT